MNKNKYEDIKAKLYDNKSEHDLDYNITSDALLLYG